MNRLFRYLHRNIFITVTIIAISSFNNVFAQPGLIISKQQDSILSDRDGNRYLIKKMEDGNLWITSNLNLNVPGSYCYGNIRTNCEQYGRLYNWESAQQGCALLGDGWRLPSNEEWQVLTKIYGGFNQDSTRYKQKAYKSFLEGGDSGFKIVMGGGRDTKGNYARLDAHGFYWTASATDAGNAWFYNLGKGGQFVNRHEDGEKSGAFAVRCVRTPVKPKE